MLSTSSPLHLVSTGGPCSAESDSESKQRSHLSEDDRERRRERQRHAHEGGCKTMADQWRNAYGEEAVNGLEDKVRETRSELTVSRE